jgi:ABC-type dipeptide/oligopeptide/nickel transport system permease subunit
MNFVVAFGVALAVGGYFANRLPLCFAYSLLGALLSAVSTAVIVLLITLLVAYYGSTVDQSAVNPLVESALTATFQSFIFALILFSIARWKRKKSTQLKA